MVYLLINNRYQWNDFNSWYHESLSTDGFSLIQVPHQLEPITADSRFKSIHQFPYFFEGLSSLTGYKGIKSLHKKIDGAIKPSKNDILFVYTEYEILNQYIIGKFYEAGAKIWLLEDGLATMAVFNMHKRKLPLKLLLIRTILRTIYKYVYLDFLFDGTNSFPVMSDNIFEGVIVNLGVSIKRQIPLYRRSVNINSALKGLDQTTAIFLNADLYNFYCTLNEYLTCLDVVLDRMQKIYTKIYFKYHPRETLEIRPAINAILGKYNIDVIDNNGIIEEFIEEYKPKFAVSFCSASSLNLWFKGLEPVYLFHLFPQVVNEQSLLLLASYLRSINYNFIDRIDSLTQDYCSGIQVSDGIDISELIMKNRKCRYFPGVAAIKYVKK